MQVKTISTNYLYRGAILNLRVDTIKTNKGQTASREIVEHVDSVGIIAIDEQENLLLVKQLRYPVGKNLLEIPAGCIESGENPETTVKRELREETGFDPGCLKKLGGVYLAPGYSNEYMHIYLARELNYSPLIAEDTEEIELIKKPLPEIEEMIYSGQITDGKTIAALFLFTGKTRG